MHLRFLWEMESFKPLGQAHRLRSHHTRFHGQGTSVGRALKGRHQFKGPQLGSSSSSWPILPGQWGGKQQVLARGQLWLHFMLCHGVRVPEGAGRPARAGTGASRELQALMPEHTLPPLYKPASIGLGPSGTLYNSFQPHIGENF